jgi:hypothetical protein
MSVEEQELGEDNGGSDGGSSLQHFTCVKHVLGSCKLDVDDVFATICSGFILNLSYIMLVICCLSFHSTYLYLFVQTVGRTITDVLVSISAAYLPCVYNGPKK